MSCNKDLDHCKKKILMKATTKRLEKNHLVDTKVEESQHCINPSFSCPYSDASYRPLMIFSPITTYFSQLLSSLARPLIGTRDTPGSMVYLGGWVEGTFIVKSSIVFTIITIIIIFVPLVIIIRVDTGHLGGEIGRVHHLPLHVDHVFQLGIEH